MKNYLKCLSVVAVLAITPFAIANSNPHHVPGESLDAGIDPTLNFHVPGESLDAGYSPAPSHVLNRVPGEKQDAFADANYTWYRVAGEKRDSGLGDVTAEEMRRYVNAYGPTKVASK